MASDAIWRETKLFPGEPPLIVSMGDVAGSGGYYIAMAADVIMAEPATITGSIGVISGKFNLRGLYEDWLGIHRDQIKRARTRTCSATTGYTDAQGETVRRQIEVFYKDFVHKAAEGRGKKDQEIDLIGQGGSGPASRRKRSASSTSWRTAPRDRDRRRKAGIGATSASRSRCGLAQGILPEPVEEDDAIAGRAIKLPAKLQSVLSSFEFASGSPPTAHPLVRRVLIVSVMGACCSRRAVA